MWEVRQTMIPTEKEQALMQLQTAIVRCQAAGYELVVMPLWDCGRRHTVLMLRDVGLTDGRLVDLSIQEAGDERR